MGMHSARCGRTPRASRGFWCMNLRHCRPPTRGADARVGPVDDHADEAEAARTAIHVAPRRYPANAGIGTNPAVSQGNVPSSKRSSDRCSDGMVTGQRVAPWTLAPSHSGHDMSRPA
jgi:hypothetical protein